MADNPATDPPTETPPEEPVVENPPSETPAEVPSEPATAAPPSNGDSIITTSWIPDKSHAPGKYLCAIENDEHKEKLKNKDLDIGYNWVLATLSQNENKEIQLGDLWNVSIALIAKMNSVKSLLEKRTRLILEQMPETANISLEANAEAGASASAASKSKAKASVLGDSLSTLEDKFNSFELSHFHRITFLILGILLGLTVNLIGSCKNV